MRRCFILGRGPSLRPFVAEYRQQLDKELTIGLNFSYHIYVPKIVFGVDGRFWDAATGPTERHKWARARGIRLGTKIEHRWKTIGPHCRMRVRNAAERWPGVLSLDTPTKFPDGVTSLVYAIAMAEMMEFETAYLVGFDFRGTSERAEGENWAPEHSDHGFQTFSDACRDVVDLIEIDVVNLNPESALDVWPKQDPEEVLGCGS